MRQTNMQNSRGVALLLALFVLVIFSVLGMAMLSNVNQELKMSKNFENSERALKIAEAGVQIARSSFFDPALVASTGTKEVTSVDGFIMGGYFLTRLESNFRGNEKWTQWRHDEGLSGNNNESEITVPLRTVWFTNSSGINGSWTGNTFYVNNIYSIVARGTYFPIEGASGTLVRAHDEYTGKQKVDKDDPAFANPYYWTYDKALNDTALAVTYPFNGPVNYAVGMSPMVSFSDYTTKINTDGKLGEVIIQQTLYFAYSGSSTDLSSSADTTSTVRLRAANALCNMTNNGEPVKSLWEFDTGMHGIGTAPAFFDPDPDTPGDEIIYFAVISRGKPGSAGALDLNAADVNESRAYPSLATDDPEQLYLFAVVDTTGRVSSCTSTGTYTVKWAHPFPDPDVAEWTDYPTEHATGTNGQRPPYIRRPSDMTPFLPEEDLLADYRDGPGYNGRNSGAGKSSYDRQWNQIRGNFMGGEPAVSPPVVKALYRLNSGEFSAERADALAGNGNPDDPLIDIYLTYSALTRVSFLRPASSPWVSHWFWDKVKGYQGDGWSMPGYRKPNECHTYVIALRDRVVRNGSAWNWNSAKSRFPTFKWTYKVPGWDPDQTDQRPPNGYGVYNWDTWYGGSVAPMINTLAWNQDATKWGEVKSGSDKLAGDANLYTILYPYYKSAGFVHGGAERNDTSTGRKGPKINEGSPVNFSGDSWTDTRVMISSVRDTWEDYMEGKQTNPLWQAMATGVNPYFSNPSRSNPVEPYWTHQNAAADPNTVDALGHSLITYNAALKAQYPANTNKIGFPRPYQWWEALWAANVRGAADAAPQSLYSQGWAGVVSGSKDTSLDVDVEGETSAMCKECLNTQGLMVFAFNHDLDSTGDHDGNDADDREDLRIHGINATTGVHQWDYHMAASLAGDDSNSTPAIANNRVFVAYEKFGNKTVNKGENRQVILQVLSAEDGSAEQSITVDSEADAIIMPPTIANGAVYVGTYSFGSPRTLGDGNKKNDYIRLFAMSPVLRLVSTGIYPMEYRSYTTIDEIDYKQFLDQNSTTFSQDPSIRQLQVWITGTSSKWEEVREMISPPNP